jgi:hypothetical protein
VLTGGFKRTEGAFREGELVMKHHGSHYGFLENGTVFSKLVQGLTIPSSSRRSSRTSST